MSLHDRLGARLLIALVCAGAAIAGLAWAVEAFEAGPKPTLRAQPDAPGSARGDGAPTDAAPFELPEPGVGDQLGVEVAALVGSLAVSDRLSAVPPDVAPVVEVLPDGALALRRGVPLAAAPGASRALSRDGYGACVVLPGSRLAELTPAARGALCDLLMQWFPERPVPVSRLRSLGARISGQEWGRLLAWLP